VPLPASSANGVCQATKCIKVETSKAPDQKMVTMKDTMQTNNLTLETCLRAGRSVEKIFLSLTPMVFRKRSLNFFI